MKYKYKCSHCDEEMVIEHSMKEDAKTTCPKCNNETLTRVIEASTFLLKGDGWTSYEKSGRYHPKKGS